MKKQENDPFELFRESTELANKIWRMLKKWSEQVSEPNEFYILSTPGIITVNIPEKRRRRLFREDPMISRFARGSLFEAKTLLILAKNHQIVDEKEFESFLHAIDNQLIKLSKINTTDRFPPAFQS
jgi:four helix bundle protein